MTDNNPGNELTRETDKMDRKFNKAKDALDRHRASFTDNPCYATAIVYAEALGQYKSVVDDITKDMLPAINHYIRSYVDQINGYYKECLNELVAGPMLVGRK